MSNSTPPLDRPLESRPDISVSPEPTDEELAVIIAAVLNAEASTAPGAAAEPAPSRWARAGREEAFARRSGRVP